MISSHLSVAEHMSSAEVIVIHDEKEREREYVYNHMGYNCQVNNLARIASLVRAS